MQGTSQTPKSCVEGEVIHTRHAGQTPVLGRAGLTADPTTRPWAKRAVERHTVTAPADLWTRVDSVEATLTDGTHALPEALLALVL